MGLREPHLLPPPLPRSSGKVAYLSLQHQFLGEERCFLAEGLSLLHQAWEVSGSSGAFDACVRRKEKFAMKRGPRGLVYSKDGPLHCQRPRHEMRTPSRGRAEGAVDAGSVVRPRSGKLTGSRQPGRGGHLSPAAGGYGATQGDPKKVRRRRPSHARQDVGRLFISYPPSSQPCSLPALTTAHRSGPFTNHTASPSHSASGVPARLTPRHLGFTI